ncbi:hypothetical protein [Saccharothrix stipae]
MDENAPVAQEGTADLPGLDPTDPTIDPCLSAPPHAVIHVPAKFGEQKFVSKDGGYYYAGQGCHRYIVDIYMASYSNQNPNSNGEWTGPGFLNVAAGPYDLPSSADFGGDKATVEEDCGRLYVGVAYYRKLSTESVLTHVGHGVWKGSWTAGQPSPCGYVQKVKQGDLPGTWSNTSGSGWDLLRVAVYVRLRDSGQKAGVFLTQPPPS